MFDSKQFFHTNLLGILHSTEILTQPAVAMVVTNMRYGSVLDDSRKVLIKQGPVSKETILIKGDRGELREQSHLEGD